VSNLLILPGVIESPHYVTGWDGVQDDHVDPMPNKPKAYVCTDKGMRHLLQEETGNGLSIPKQWVLLPEALTNGFLTRTPSVFHWEYLYSIFTWRCTHTGDLESNSLSFEDKSSSLIAVAG
jgi:hypothetical protein